MNRPLVALTAALVLVASASIALPSSTSKMTAKTAALDGVPPPSAVQREQRVAQLIVKLRDPSAAEIARPLAFSRMQSLSLKAGVTIKAVRAMSGNASLVAFDAPMPLSEAKAVAARLALDPQVEYAEPDVIMKRLITPTDQRYFDWQWNFRAPTETFAGLPAKPGILAIGGANMPAAWDITTGASTVTVAIIDTGITNHGDLNGVTSGATYVPSAPGGRWLPGYDFISSNVGQGAPANFVANDGDGRDSDPSDPGDWVTAEEERLYPDLCDDQQAGPQNSSWHGTHMAAQVASLWNNPIGANPAYGIGGAAPGVRILPLRALGKCGGALSDIADAIVWAAGGSVPGVANNPTPVDFSSLSLGGGSTCGPTLQAAVSASIAANVLVFAATGNEGSVGLIAPANCNGVVAITAHTINGDNADYANVGSNTSLSAPGGGSPTLLGTGGPTDDLNWSGGGISGAIRFGYLGPESAGFNGQIGPAFGRFTGTSAATPQAAGVAALIKTIQPSATPRFIKAWLTMRNSISAHPPGGACVAAIFDCGKGLLNGQRALVAAQNGTPAVVTPTFMIVAPNTVVNLTADVAAFTGRSITQTTWQQTAGAPTVALTNASTVSASFTAPATGVFGFDFEATDNTGIVGADRTIVRVNSPPVLTQVPPAMTATVGQTVSFNVSATDPDGTTPSFSATALPTGATLSTTGQFSWNTTGETPGTYVLTYRASDQFSTSSPATVNITLTAPAPSGAPPPSGGGGGGGSLPFWQVLLLITLSFAGQVRVRNRA